MEIKELREKGRTELMKLLKEARIELVRLKTEREVDSLADGSVIRKKRREIARLLTILKEKEILGEVSKVSTSPRKVSGSRGTKDAKKKT